MTPTPAADDYRLLSSETLREPYDFWSALRGSSPVHTVDEGIGYVVVSRYEDVTAVLRDTETFASELSLRFKGGVSAYEDSSAVKEVMKDACPFVGTLNFTDGEAHARHRRAVRRGFTMRRVKELEEVVEQIVADLLDELPFDEPVDLVRQLCIPLPIRVMAYILGLEVERSADVRRWAEAQVARFGQPREDEEENLAIARSIVEMHRYLQGELKAREAEPREDFLSDLVQSEDEVTRDELVLICAQLMVAGSESTASLVGSLIDRLLAAPEQLERLREDRSLIPGAVEETLRTESPIKCAYRFTTRDAEVAGRTVPKGSVVLVLFGSANRDEEAFPNPEDFEVSRQAGAQHLAFGMGAHLCSGATLARSEARIAFDALLDRVGVIEALPKPAPAHEANLTVRALSALPVVLRRPAA